MRVDDKQHTCHLPFLSRKRQTKVMFYFQSPFFSIRLLRGKQKKIHSKNTKSPLIENLFTRNTLNLQKLNYYCGYDNNELQ